MMGRVVKFVKSLLEALLLNWTVFILDVNSKPKSVQSDRQQAGTLPTLNSLRSANRVLRIFAKTNVFKNFYLLFFKQFTV